MLLQGIIFWMLLSIHIWGMDLEICWIKNMVVVTNGSEVVLCVYRLHILEDIFIQFNSLDII